MEKLEKLLVILGPTASGKTSLAIKLAKKFDGEIISADSRQVYKYMKIGTDVPDGETVDGRYMVQGIPHHLINLIDPAEDFSLADFKRETLIKIKDIHNRGKLPILVGGTGLYISTIVDNLDIPKVKPNKELRKELEDKSLSELVNMLREKDSDSYKVVDVKNPRRVLRALEVVLGSGQSFIQQRTKSKPEFDCLQVGIKRDREEIYQRINTRIDEMIEQGLVDEVNALLKRGYGWDINSMSGLGYRQFKNYIAGTDSLENAINCLKQDTRHYAKRQISWFRRDKAIKWFNSTDLSKIDTLVTDFLCK